MTDHLTKAKRSWNMSRIRSKDTRPEKIVRSFLHKKGYRFRLHRKDLPGNPDIVLPRYRTVIFVHGCYWHRHKGCKNCTTPTTNQDFWISKFKNTIKRDKENIKQLKRLGWKVFVIWECEVNNKNKLSTKIIKRIGR